MFALLIPLLAGLAVYLVAQTAQSRFKEIRLRQQALALAATPPMPGRPRQAFVRKTFFKLLAALARVQEAWVSPAWKMKMEKELLRWPKWSGHSAAEWLAAKEASACAALGFGWLLGAGFLLNLGLAGMGFYLPDLWFREWKTAQKRRILRELPDTLDLLASCLEAGLGFEQSLGVLLERRQPGAMVMEWTELMRLIRMGLSRPDALRSLGARVQDPDFSTFVSSLLQAESLGVSVAAALKQQASQQREKRAQAVEKQALEAPVKLLFPLVAFIFPVVFLVLFGPILVRFLQGF